MSKLISSFIALALFSLTSIAYADNVTLVLSDEQISGKNKICEYNNANYSFTYTIKNYQTCPHTRTFDSDDQE